MLKPDKQQTIIPQPKSARFKVAIVFLIVGVLLFLGSIICLISLDDIEDDYDLLTFGLIGASVGFVLLLIGVFLRSRIRLRSITKWVVIILFVLLGIFLVWFLASTLPYR